MSYLAQIAARALPAEMFEQFRRRVIQDAMSEAAASYWQRRADQFEAARPRPGDYHGKATASEIEERDQRLAETAAACRCKAQFVTLYGVEFDELWDEVHYDAA